MSEDILGRILEVHDQQRDPISDSDLDQDSPIPVTLYWTKGEWDRLKTLQQYAKQRTAALEDLMKQIADKAPPPGPAEHSDATFSEANKLAFAHGYDCARWELSQIAVDAMKTSDKALLRAQRAETELRERAPLLVALELIAELNGDQPARSNWDMLRLARAALASVREGAQ